MIHFSYFEQAIFAILVVASVSLFWRRFGKVWNNISASKSDPDLSLQHLGRRVRDFIWEVVLQGKVIRQRPLPGLAHALVFWGFCAFALVSLNHFAEGVNTGFLNRYTWPGKFYFVFAAIFAIGVAIGIAGLAFRRFVIRPRWLGHVSYESGFIAFLIFLLMLTHLVTFRVGWAESKGDLVGAHAGHPRFPAADSAHQASAPGAQPRYGISQARSVQQDPTARRRRRFRAGYR